VVTEVCTGIIGMHLRGIVGLDESGPRKRPQHLFSTYAGEQSIRRSCQAIDMEGVVGGPDRDRTGDLFHAIS